MPGVRLHHVTQRHKTFRMEHYGRMIKHPDGSLRPKVYDIPIDDGGNCIVSETVWMRIQEAGYGHEFLIMNEVAQPPSQTLELILPPKATVPTF